jgi:anthraniloyl-CoA monooxygenase
VARIVGFAHAQPREVCLQLGTPAQGLDAARLGGGQYPLPAGNWETMAPSSLPYSRGSARRREMNARRHGRVLATFVAARASPSGGFDMLELHMAHGYLLASFLSPLTNRRPDAYGGDVGSACASRSSARAVRAAWPRTSRFRCASPRATGRRRPQRGRADRDRARDEARGRRRARPVERQTVPGRSRCTGACGRRRSPTSCATSSAIPTIAVGNIFEADHANSIVASGRADLCALARPHLADPAWTLRAAAEQQFAEQWWPSPYASARRQLERNLERAAQMTGPV